jgi:putative phosphoesterase
VKVALLGDIHGNDRALAAVLRGAERHGVERLLITGDLIGYYFWPKHVLELLAPWQFVAVRGNHEAMLAEARRNPDYLSSVETKYGSGLRVAIETISPEELDWLEKLPHPLEVEIESCRILLCHGAPWDINQYVYPDASQDLLERCTGTGHEVVVLGHTHYPMTHWIGGTMLLNPGSTGQPRKRDSGAEWALLDTDSIEVTLMKEPYDITPVVEASVARHPEIPFLANVLEGLR